MTKIATLFALALVLAVPAVAQETCPTTPGYSGEAWFTVTGMVLWPYLHSNGQVVVSIDLNSGRMWDITNVVCGGNLPSSCLALETGASVTLGGVILPQGCPEVVPPSPTVAVRLRATSLVIR